jgi:hypothetical protein
MRSRRETFRSREALSPSTPAPSARQRGQAVARHGGPHGHGRREHRCGSHACAEEALELPAAGVAYDHCLSLHAAFRRQGRHRTRFAQIAGWGEIAGAPTAMNLDADDIEAVAARVVELLREHTGATGRYVDAATLARMLGVDRDWVYSRAPQLGAVRLGDGPKARLRFDIERVRATLAGAGPGQQPQRDDPPRRRRGRPRRPAGPVGVPLIQGRSSR